MRFSTDQFTQHGETHQFISEASSLGFAVGQWPDQLTLYNSTGVEGTFYRKKINRNRDSQVVSVEYGNAGIYGLYIYND